VMLLISLFILLLDISEKGEGCDLDAKYHPTDLGSSGRL